MKLPFSPRLTAEAHLPAAFADPGAAGRRRWHVVLVALGWAALGRQSALRAGGAEGWPRGPEGRKDRFLVEVNF